MGTVVESDGFVMESSNSDEAAVKASIAPAEAAPSEPSPAETVAEGPEGEQAREEDSEGKERDEKGRFKSKEEQESDKKRPPKRNNPLARIQAVTSQAARYQKQRDAAIAELNAAQRELESIRTASASRTDKEPVETDFNDYTDFVKARARYDARQEYDAQRIQQAEARHNEALQAERDRRISTFQEKLKEAGGQDFLAKADPAVLELMPISILPPGEKPTQANAVAELILLSENPPALIEYLSRDKAEFQRLVKLPMTQLELSRQIAKIEARLEVADSAGPAPKLEISQAKPPIKPVTGSPQSVGELSEDAPFEEWFEKQNQKDRAARR